ncbi:hypothetical protein PR048_017991 [Dryococelus australis]|uniref:PiggyBac transposable element-derived protein domain-containing protein n=1 Tax=Dryococelus australis TaxID=614101 RepID=A0ABQ9HB65_9NEOP|nr:hypothetical protein PR048_017991 [Dryococelus australis]
MKEFGYKVWCLTFVQGYLVNFSIYQGKSRSNTVCENYFGKATASLIQMIERFSAEIRTLPFEFFFGNLFTGLNLLSFLRDQDCGGTGTMRNNRISKSFPMTSNSILLKKERGHHESPIVKEDGVTVSKWVDNSVVSIATNWLGVEPQSTAKLNSQEEKRIIQVQRPILLTSIVRKCMVLTIWNKMQLARSSGKKSTWLEFRREIVQVYLSRFANPSKGLGRPSNSSNKSRIPEQVRFDCLNHPVKKYEKKDVLEKDGS